MAQAQLDDLADSGLGQGGDKVADLAIGVVCGGVKERGGKLDFKALGALDKIDHCVGQSFGWDLRQNFSGGLGEFGLGLGGVFIGLGVFDQRGGAAEFARKESSGLGGETSLGG